MFSHLKFHSKRGHLILLIPIAIAFFILRPEIALKIIPALFLIVLLPKFHLEIIGIASVLAFTFGHKDLGHDPQRAFLNQFGNTLAVTIGTLSGLASMLAFRSFIHDQLTRRSWVLRGISAVFLSYLVLYLIVRSELYNPWLGALFAGVMITWAKLVWYFAYDLQRQPRQSKFNTAQHLAYYRPFWSLFFYAPMPKGENYWRQIQVSSAEELTRCRVNGAIFIIWGTAIESLRLFFYGYYRQFTIGEALKTIYDGMALRSAVAWISVGFDFFDNLLMFTSYSYIIVGVIFFVGYKSPMNTNRPLQAKNPLDFFQRYNFFYKELLFQFFFFPAFAKLKILPARLRVSVSLFWAVAVGNFLIIYFRNADLHFSRGLQDSFVLLSNYAVYSLLLFFLLLPSVLANISDRPKPESSKTLVTLGTILTILAFATIRIFDEQFSGNLALNFSLLKILFGMEP